jgi:hypothetical protein
MSFQPSNPVPGLQYHTFDMERGLRHMDLYGVSYYVSFTPEAASKAGQTMGFEQIAVTEPFYIFRLPETDLVVPATHQPSVYDPAPTGGAAGEFHDFALEWYEEIDQMHRWVVADGPDDWPRISTLGERPDTALSVPENAVSDIEVDHHRISFSTEAIGVPHLVKVSYFPNWSATGAEGPYRAAPSLMVVVPTDNDVVLEFGNTWAESLGLLLTLVGVTALVVWVVVDRRRVRRSEAAVGS